MIADCPGCAPAAADVLERSGARMKPRTKLRWLALVPGALAVLAPKCPMCLVAYLSAFGVTFGMASFALSILCPLTIVFAVLALAFALRGSAHS